MLKLFKSILFAPLIMLAPTIATAAVYDIAQLGAVGNGVTDNTTIIQGAIDQCSEEGGGMVLLDGGTFMSRTIYMKSNVTLRIESGSTLLANPDIKTYPTDTHHIMYKRETHMDRCFIFARDAKNFSFEGKGTIDGNGHTSNFNKGGRPMLLRFIDCENIRMSDINLINPAAWTSAWLYCNNIAINNIYIHSRVNGNGDGLDFDGCQNVRVTNCDFDNSDDCICLQTSRPDKPCQFITISNCTFKTKWGGIRIGLLSRGTIGNVTVSNCTFQDIQDSGLKIQQNEGGKMENMVFSNLVMTNVPRPIFMTFCKMRACVDLPEGTREPLQSMGNFLFQNIVVDNSAIKETSTFVFTGIPEHYITNVARRDVLFIHGGGGTKEQAKRRNIPEYDDESMNRHWPEFKCLGGALPASGIFARHIKNFTVDNFQLQTKSPDARPLIVTSDTPELKVTNATIIK